MKKKHLQTLFVLAGLIALSCTALAFATKKKPFQVTPVILPHQVSTSKNGVKLTGKLIQNKIHANGNGFFSLALDLAADEIVASGIDKKRNVDMVIVLDRSGSMEGEKIQKAKQAILKVIENMTQNDRLALVSYSDGVISHSGLIDASPANRAFLTDAVKEIQANGGTNLGSGLLEGLRIIRTSAKIANSGKIILISDGHANQGITGLRELGTIAQSAGSIEASITTVGVGLNFNELLMTAISDKGTGNYYFLENPNAFAPVFLDELHKTRIAAATGVEIHVPLHDGVTLADAAGYPISVVNGVAIFSPGDILSGQTRKLFLSFNAPTDTEKTYDIRDIKVKYHNNGEEYNLMLPGSFQVACVRDIKAVYASIDKVAWSQKARQKDLNNLRNEVASKIREGKKEDALKKIEVYRATQKSVAQALGATADEGGYGAELEELRDTVNDTFTGAPAAVAAKQKKNAKTMQYEGLKKMRSLK